MQRSVRGPAQKSSSLSVQGDVLEAAFGEAITKDMNFIIAKSEFIANVLRYLPEIKKIRAVEEYVRKEDSKKEDEKTEAKAPAATPSG